MARTFQSSLVQLIKIQQYNPSKAIHNEVLIHRLEPWSVVYVLLKDRRCITSILFRKSVTKRRSE